MTTKFFFSKVLRPWFVNGRYLTPQLNLVNYVGNRSPLFCGFSSNSLSYSWKPRISTSTKEHHKTNETYVTRENSQKSGRSVTVDSSASTEACDSIGTEGANALRRHVYSADWSTHELFMVTCAEMWDDWSSGAQVIVGYIDTAAMVMDKWREQMPTALVLTSGLTNSIEIIKPVLQALVDQGYRLIIPNPIGYGTTRGLSKTDEDCFSNLIGERSAFVLDFASALGISRFDVAIGHNLGCDPLTVLAANFKMFDNIVLISPVPGIKPLRMIQPVWLTRRLLYWSFNWLRRPVAWLWFRFVFRSHLLKHSGADERFSFRRMQVILSTLHGVNFNTMASMATMIEARQTPVLYIYSDADELVDGQSSVEYSELFGVTSQLTYSYTEKERQPTVFRNTERSSRGVRLPCSTSQLSPVMSRIVANEILALVEHDKFNNVATNDSNI